MLCICPPCIILRAINSLVMRSRKVCVVLYIYESKVVCLFGHYHQLNLDGRQMYKTSLTPGVVTLSFCLPHSINIDQRKTMSGQTHCDFSVLYPWTKSEYEFMGCCIVPVGPAVARQFFLAWSGIVRPHFVELILDAAKIKILGAKVQPTTSHIILKHTIYEDCKNK